MKTQEEFPCVTLLKNMMAELSGDHFYDAGIELSDAEFDEAESGYLEGLEG